MPLVTLVSVKVRRVPATELWTVTTLPEVPVMDHVPIVPKLLENLIVCATAFVEASSANEVVEITVNIVVDVALEPPMVTVL